MIGQFFDIMIVAPADNDDNDTSKSTSWILLETALSHLKGARSRYFRQFQHWSNCHKINLNFKKTGQNYKRTRKKTQERQEETWMDKTWEDWRGLHLDKFEKRRPTFFQICGISVYTCIKLSITQLENNSQLLCGHDFTNERILVCQFDV